MTFSHDLYKQGLADCPFVKELATKCPFFKTQIEQCPFLSEVVPTKELPLLPNNITDDGFLVSNVPDDV